MAKAKKETLTIEERLQQALVSESEQPYAVPDNWVWVRLPSVCAYIRAGGDKPKIFSETKTATNAIPVVANGISNDGIIGFTNIENEKQDTVTISGRGTIGFAVLRDYPYYPIVRLIVVAPQKTILPKFLKLIFDNFIEEGVGSSIPQLTVPMLKEKAIPLPPLVEQRRIVAAIESLFEKLDKAKELAQSALDSFETRKAAILHKAFTGELTAKWREENCVSMESWKEKSLKELGSFRLGKMLDKAKNKGTQTNYLRNVNVRWFGFDLSDVSEMAATKDDKNTFSVQYGDLFICEGGEPGRCAIWEEQQSDLIYQKALHRFRSNGLIVGKLLAYFLYFTSQSDELSQHFTGTTIKHLTGQSLAKIMIWLPPLPEQQEIVRILDSLLENEQKAKDLCDVIEKIDLMKKAILARAFRSELGTNDPSEESALGLLKEVLADK